MGGGGTVPSPVAHGTYGTICDTLEATSADTTDDDAFASMDGGAMAGSVSVSCGSIVTATALVSGGGTVGPEDAEFTDADETGSDANVMLCCTIFVATSITVAFAAGFPDCSTAARSLWSSFRTYSIAGGQTQDNNEKTKSIAVIVTCIVQ